MKHPLLQKDACPLLLTLFVAQAIGLAATSLGSFNRFADHHAVDLGVYMESSRRVLEGQLPYRDFDLEYPPLAIVPFTLPRLIAANYLPSATAYRGLFLAVMVICSTALAFVVARSCRLLPVCRSPARSVLIYAIGVMTLGPFLGWRFDLFPALLTGVALFAYLRAQPIAAGCFLGLAAAAKLYPVILLPVFGADALARRDYRCLVRLVVAAGAALAAILLPFMLISAHGLGRMFAYHAERGLEIGSVPAGLGLLADQLGFTQGAIEFRFGAVQTVFPWSDTVLRLLPVITVTALLTVTVLAYIRFRRDVETSQHTGTAMIPFLSLALLAFTLTSKVLSPQYVAWLLPFFPLLPGRHARWLLIGCALTTALFPWQFVALLEQRGAAVLLLNVRNALLLVGALWLLRDVARRATLNQRQPLQNTQENGRRGEN